MEGPNPKYNGGEGRERERERGEEEGNIMALVVIRYMVEAF